MIYLKLQASTFNHNPTCSLLYMFFPKEKQIIQIFLGGFQLVFITIKLLGELNEVKAELLKNPFRLFAQSCSIFIFHFFHVLGFAGHKHNYAHFYLIHLKM